MQLHYRGQLELDSTPIGIVELDCGGSDCTTEDVKLGSSEENRVVEIIISCMWVTWAACTRVQKEESGRRFMWQSHSLWRHLHSLPT